jgi:16S rRNA (guanine1207-N2)-methyltransferase
MAMFENPSLLLDRSLNKTSGGALADCQQILLVNYCADDYCLELANTFKDKQFTAFNYNFAAHQSLTNKPDNGPDNLQSFCSHSFSSETEFDCVVIYFPKSKPEFEYLLNNVFNHVKIGAPIYVVGDNKGGVKTCEKLLKPFCTPVKKVDAAKHCALYLTTLNEQSKPFVASDWYKSYQVEINQVELTIYSLPGVFSHGALDMGTRILLENLEGKPEGKILDFGCGAGLIGAYLAKVNENVTITGLDVSALAIESTFKTYQANNIEGTAIISNGLSEVKSTFNQVYSNPPFHSGVKTNYAITELFLNSVKEFIQPRGRLSIVANNFLNYQPLLEKQFGGYNTVAKNRRFNVYHATKGRN